VSSSNVSLSLIDSSKITKKIIVTRVRQGLGVGKFGPPEKESQSGDHDKSYPSPLKNESEKS
jgi:hypothetical protein